jgi:hypothetical protein
VLGWQEAQDAGAFDCLDAVANLEFAEDVGCVIAHGVDGDDQVVGDLFVGEASRQELQDLKLSLC